MARYQGSLKAPFSIMDFHTPGKGWDHEAEKRAQQQWLDEIKADLQIKVKGDLIGEEIRFPRGDGCARYLITSEKPFTLVHLNVGDAWHADPATLRGFRLQDARAEVARSRRSQALKEVYTKNSQDFYEKNLDKIVHYDDGFGRFIRCVVVRAKGGTTTPRIETGELCLKQQALVGKWHARDLRHDAYRMRSCREGRLFQPHLSNIYEFNQEGKEDPRELPPCLMQGQQELSFT